MTPAAWSYGLCGLAYTAFGLYLMVLLRRGAAAGVRAGTMLGAVMLSAVWGWLGFALGPGESLDFQAAGIVVDVLRFGGWYAFLLLLLHPGRQGNTEYSDGPSRLLGGVVVLLVVLGLVTNGLIALNIGFTGELSRLGLFHLLAMSVLALVLLEQLYRNVTADWLWNIKPLCLGLAGAFMFDLYLYSDGVLFGGLDLEISSMRGAVHALVVPLLVLSVNRNRGWTARIRLSRKAVLHTASLVAAGLYLLFVSAVGYYVRYFGGEWGRALQVAVVFAAFLALAVLALSRTMRARLRVWVGKHFFTYRYDYREEWLRFTNALSAQQSPREMGQQVIRGLADLLESPAGALWLKDHSQPGFSQAALWNMSPVAAREEEESSLCRFLATSGWVINLEEYRCFRGRYDGLELPGWLGTMPNAWMVVPLLAGRDLVGFVVLASPRVPLEVNWEVNDLLKTAGRQAASFLAQMQATEALLEVRKFDAFNRMSAFVVHDLKNIVSQLSLMVRNAERHSDKPEFRQDMLMTVEHSVERMRQLMLQLRLGEASPGSPCGVDLAQVIGRIQAARGSQGRAVEAQVMERLVTRGEEARIERVIGHLVQNAQEATEAGGRVWVRLDRQGGLARIEVGDTGQGMSPEFLRERLFRPFQTTKQAGMGIGAYESFQYVQELGGKILVDSEIDKGTRVTMLLPLLEVGTGSDLRQEAA